MEIYLLFFFPDAVASVVCHRGEINATARCQLLLSSVINSEHFKLKISQLKKRKEKKLVATSPSPEGLNSPTQNEIIVVVVLPATEFIYM